MSRKLADNQIFHWHEPTKEMAIEHIENIQPLIESNKKLQQEDHFIKDDFIFVFKFFSMQLKSLINYFYFV